MFINPHQPGRVFVFIDETGDPGHPEVRDSSSFYLLNLVVSTRRGLGKLLQQMSRFRFFHEADKELERYLARHERQVCDMLNVLASSSEIKFFSFWLRKVDYAGPYLTTRTGSKFDWHPSKFRNFVIRKSLEAVFDHVLPGDRTELFTKGLEVELVFDRFLQRDKDEEGLRTYLRNNYRLPHLAYIVQIDSEYSDAVQAADLLGRLVKRSLIDQSHPCELEYVSMHSLNTPSRL